MKYIVVQHGYPHVADVLPVYDRLSRLAVLARTWEHQHAFDESSRYALTLDHEPVTNICQRVLAHTIYNPSVAVSAKWSRVGESQIPDIIALVEDGLQRDDDIIQQWFGASEVIQLLKAASNWDELATAVSCIGGAHEVDDKARRYVAKVLRDRK